MAEKAHSMHGASSAKRWISCPGSINAIKALPEEDQNTSSLYAAEGQAAHNLCDLALRESMTLKGVADMIGTAVPDDEGAFHECTDEMAEAVCVYLTEIQLQKDTHAPDSDYSTEGRLDLTWLRPSMFGTADFILAEPFGELIVTDFKYGRGVVVEVTRNDQLMYYALGALKNAGGPDEFEKVTIVVVQPRAPHSEGPVRRWSISARELWDWGQNTLGPAYDATLQKEAPRNPGDWCQFCPAYAGCDATRALVQREAKMDFASPIEPPVPTTSLELAQALDAIPLIEGWCKAVRKEAMTRAIRGEAVPGHKLVRGRANRQWRDEAAAEKTLRGKRGVKVDDIFDKKFKSPARIEKFLNKLVGTSSAQTWMTEHAVKPEGALSLVPESDKREAVAVDAASDFANAPALPGQAGREFANIPLPRERLRSSR